VEALTGQVCLVTGASKGIGAAVARRLAAAGARVVLTARSRQELEVVCTSIREAGDEAHPVAGDLCDERFVEALFGHIVEEHGRLDALVNNAGMAPFGPTEEFPVERLRECLELNVVAAFACMRAAIRLMRAQGGRGKIVNIGSVRSHWTESGDAGAYNASKFALRALTESIARELQGTGQEIAVGMVCPGIVDTTLTNPAGEPRPDWLAPETVAEAVLHALVAPANVNVFDITVFPTSQRPW
jgi:NAD(P)-dependent dehydrogenase (short-subunit alcohol dehydrogenase family)